jgi:hypothetical protein
VVSDPTNPQNEGKVFLFKFGAQIKDMLLNAMKPEFEQDDAINPFSIDADGANFRIKIKRENGYITYKYSKFDSQNALSQDESAKSRILKSQYALKPFNDASNFKSYDELKARMNEVLGGDVRGVASPQKTAEDVADELVEKKPSLKSKKPVEQDVDDESDALSYFQRLAQE